MATKKVCPESDALAAALLTVDEGTASRYIEQIAGMNALEKIWDTSVLKIATAQLNGMINATVLKNWTWWEIAKQRLVNQMAKSNIGSAKNINDMLTSLDNFNKRLSNGEVPQDLLNVIQEWGDEWIATFEDAVDKLYTHFANKYELDEAYKVIDDVVKDADKGNRVEALKKAKPTYVKNKYNTLKKEGLIAEDNIVDFREKCVREKKATEEWQKNLIKKKKSMTEQEFERSMNMYNKVIENYNLLLKEIDKDEMYKEWLEKWKKLQRDVKKMKRGDVKYMMTMDETTNLFHLMLNDNWDYMWDFVRRFWWDINNLLEHPDRAFDSMFIDSFIELKDESYHSWWIYFLDKLNNTFYWLWEDEVLNKAGKIRNIKEHQEKLRKIFVDLVELYKKWELVWWANLWGKVDVSVSKWYSWTRFYEPQDAQKAEQIWETANKKVNSKNKKEVNKARADFIIYSEQPWYLDTIWITEEEAARKRFEWAEYSDTAHSVSQEINEWVPVENRYSWIELCSSINQTTITDDMLLWEIKGMKWRSTARQREYIVNSMLAFDTHMYWWDLTFDFWKRLSWTRHGEYHPWTMSIAMKQRWLWIETVAHEMWHYIDHQWWLQLFWKDEFSFDLPYGRWYLTMYSTQDALKNLPWERWVFVRHFNDFVDNIISKIDFEQLEKTGKKYTTYREKRTEAFARFCWAFTEWVQNLSHKGTSKRRQEYWDEFADEDFFAFMKLLQEKSAIDLADSDYMAKLEKKADINYPNPVAWETTQPTLFEMSDASMDADTASKNISNDFLFDDEDEILKQVWYQPEERSKVILNMIKNWLELPNTDSTYIAMREILGSEDAYNNYVVARVLLSEGSDVVENVLQKIWVTELFWNTLTKETIENINNMEDLVSVAFSFTKWLKDNKELRDLFLQKKDLILWQIDSVEKLGVVDALYNIWNYGDNYTAHLKYDLFSNKLYSMWYILPKDLSTKEVYNRIWKAIINNVNFTVKEIDWKKVYWFKDRKSLTLEWPSGEKTVISWDDLRRLLPSFLPADTPFVNFKDIITIAWYDDYLSKLEYAVKKVEPTKKAIDDYDEIAQQIRWDIEEVGEEVDISWEIFDQEKLEVLARMYEKMLSDPKAKDRMAIFLKAVTKQNIDTKKTILLNTTFDNSKDAAENQVKADLYNWLSDKNSVPVGDWIQWFKPTDVVTEDLAKNTEFVLIEWWYVDDTMQNFINEINAIRESKKLQPVTVVKNKMYNKWRFYIKNKQLRFSLISSADYDDFVNNMLSIGIDFSTLENTDMPSLYKLYADYVDAAYGWKSPNEQLQKLEKLLWLQWERDKQGRLIIDKEWDIKIDVYALDQFIQSITETTWKFKAEVVDLRDKWLTIWSKSESSLIEIANQFAEEMWLPWVKDIKGIDVENARETLFAAMFNTNIEDAIKAKYAFLKICGITWVARDSDKVWVINYLFNKQLRQSWYNMWVLQSDTFIKKLVDWESIEDDLWKDMFINANAGNPNFTELAWETLEDKFDTLVNNTKDTIGFDRLNNELSFPDWEGARKISKMPHRWEQAVYRMLVDPVYWKFDNLMGSLEQMWLYLWMKKSIKNAQTKDLKFVTDVLEEYKKAMQDVWQNWKWYSKAIELKQELHFILSTINNKVILPSYVWVVPEETLKRIAMLWLNWIPLNVVDRKNTIEQFISEIDNLEQEYKNLWELVKDSKKKISKMSNTERWDKAIQDWIVTIVDKNWGIANIKMDDVITTYLDNVRNSWVRFTDEANNLLQLTEWDLRHLSNRQKYEVFKKLSLLKKYSDYFSLYKQTYYRQHSLLATSDFFNNYKLGDDNYPILFKRLKAKIITDANLSDRDIQLMAQNVYDSLMVSSFTEWKSIAWAEKMKFGSNYKAPSLEIISKAISDQLDMIEWLTDKQRERIQHYMESIFNPYSELESIPADSNRMIKEVLWKSLDDFATALWFTKEQALEEYWDMIITQEWWQPTTIKELFNIQDSQEMLPNYIRDWNGQLVEINKLYWPQDAKWLNEQVNKANDIILSTVNDFNIVTDLDKATAKDSYRWVSWLFRQNTLLNQIARAEDRLYTEWTEIASLIKDAVFDKRILWVKKRYLAELFPRILWWQLRKSYLEETWDWIKLAYNKYYNMSLDDLNMLDLNDISDNVEWIWLRLAMYFKKLWDMLGSANWLRWVTTDADINKALYHIWDCINFTSSSAWVLSLASWLNNFQILKFVKAIKDWEWFNPFLKKISQSSSTVKRGWEEIADETTRALLWTWLEKEDINRFNQLFNWDYTVQDAQRIIFALWGFQRDNWWNRYIGRFLQWASKSSLITRVASSYPFGVMPVPLQQIWYSVKRYGLTKWLWVSWADLEAFHLLRKRDNVLVGWYFEVTDALSPQVREQINAEIVAKFGSVENFMQSVWREYSEKWDIAIVDQLSQYSWILKGDDSATVFKKIKSIWQNPEARKLLDNTKENANNLIDWFNSSAMKDLVFAQAVMRNRMYKFYSPEDYYMFMKNPAINAEFKEKVRDEIIIQANRSFIDIMWLGWWATRAVVARNGFGDAMLQLHNFINFRWQWWTTIARNFVSRMKQIFWLGWYVMKNIWKPWLADEISERLIRTPEMQNFLSDIYSTAYWGIHAQREATRNYEDSELVPLSRYDRYNMLTWLAMFMQWLSSWGRGRIVSSWFEWFMWWLGRDLSVWDSLWVAWIEILESFWQNFGRQFKFEKFVSDGLMVSIEQAGNDDFDIWSYFLEQLGNMSKGSLRYIANESWYNNYTDLKDNTWPRWIVAWTNTNKNNYYLSTRDSYQKYLSIKEAINRIWDTEDDWIDMVNVIWDILNQSTLFKVWSNIKNAAVAWYYQLEWSVESKAALSAMSKDVSDINDFATAVESSIQGQQLSNMWYYIPQDAQWVEDLYKKFVRYYAPGWANSFTRLQEYALWKELKNVRDDEMLFLEKIGKEWAARIIDKVDDVYHDKNSTTWDKRRAMILATEEEVRKLEDDPLYPEIQAYLYKGIMAFQYDRFEEQEYQKYKTERNAGIKKKKDYIAEDKADWLKFENNKYRLQQEFVDKYNKEWAWVDKQTYKNAAFKEMIRLDESGVFKPFVQWKEWTDENGEKVLEPSIKTKYRTNYDDTLKAFRLFESWDTKWAITQLSLLLRKVDYSDNSWVVGSILLNDTLKYIDELPWYDRAEKALMKFTLLNNNYDIAKKVIDNREIFGDDSYIVNLVSSMRYDVDQSLVDAIQEVAQSYETKSWGGNGARLSSLKASKIKLDKLSWSERGSWWGWSWRWRPSFNYDIPEFHWSEFLRSVNSRKWASRNDNAIRTSIQTYKEIPLTTKPKSWTPKKIKWEKKKVKTK